MTKTINHLERECFKWNLKHKYVSIERFYSVEDMFEVIGFGINWGALGTRTIKQTKEFIQTLNESIKFINYLNKEMKKMKPKYRRCKDCGCLIIPFGVIVINYGEFPCLCNSVTKSPTESKDKK